VSSRAVYTNEEIILMSSSGIVIRTKVSEISIQKRGTRGVRIMKLDGGDRLVGFTILNPEMEEDSETTETTENAENAEISKE
ncbi:MAG: hypothetical protein KAW93_01355, partial [Methanogenium sp.]|nr:hypothetical protein [Methanogenium sp.]